MDVLLLDHRFIIRLKLNNPIISHYALHSSLIRALDGISFKEWFTSHGGSERSIKKMWDPIGESLIPSYCRLHEMNAMMME